MHYLTIRALHVSLTEYATLLWVIKWCFYKSTELTETIAVLFHTFYWNRHSKLSSIFQPLYLSMCQRIDYLVKCISVSCHRYRDYVLWESNGQGWRAERGHRLWTAGPASMDRHLLGRRRQLDRGQRGQLGQGLLDDRERNFDRFVAMPWEWP